MPGIPAQHRELGLIYMMAMNKRPSSEMSECLGAMTVAVACHGPSSDRRAVLNMESGTLFVSRPWIKP